MTQGGTQWIARALSRALFLIAGLVTVVPSWVSGAEVAEEKQLKDGADAEPDEPVQQAAPPPVDDTQSSAVPPASASTGATPSATGPVIGRDDNRLLMILVTVGAVLFAAFAAWRLRRVDGGADPDGSGPPRSRSNRRK